MTKKNQVTLIGNLGDEPKILAGEKGLFATFSMATQESYKDEQDNWQKTKAIWHQVFVFDPKVVEQAKSLTKGSLVKVFGSIKYQSFTAQLTGDKTAKKWAASIVAHEITIDPFSKTPEEPISPKKN